MFVQIACIRENPPKKYRYIFHVVILDTQFSTDTVCMKLIQHTGNKPYLLLI